MDTIQLYALILFPFSFWFIFRSKVPFNQFFGILFILLHEGLIQILLSTSLFAAYKMATFPLVGILLIIASKNRQKFRINQGLSFPGFKWFFLYSIILLSSAVMNETSIRDVISYYRITLLSYSILIVFYNYRLSDKRMMQLYIFFERFVIVQIVAAFVKFNFMGFNEKIVGTISQFGGATATIFSLMIVSLLFCTYIFYKRDKKYLFWILIFLVFPVVNMKRATWFFLPVIIFTSYIYFIHYYGVGIRSSIRKLLFFLGIAVAIFYVGARINPTLNPEKRVWGSFDLTFIMDYASSYNYDEEFEQRTGLVKGRWAGLKFAFLESIAERPSMNTFFGYGMEKFIGASHGTPFFRDLGIQSKGSMTGIIYVLWSTGILAVFALLFFYGQFIVKIRKMRKYTHNKMDHLLIFISSIWVLIILIDYISYTTAFINNLQLNIIFFAVIALTLRKKGIALDKIVK